MCWRVPDSARKPRRFWRISRRAGKQDTSRRSHSRRCSSAWRIGLKRSRGPSAPTRSDAGGSCISTSMRLWIRCGATRGFGPSSPRSDWRCGETALQLCQGGPGRLRRHGRPRSVSRQVRVGRVVAASGAAAGVADQRLRVLHRHALERPARIGRKRATALRARRLAGVAVLQSPRAGRAGVDRSGDARRHQSHLGHGAGRGTPALQRQRAGRPDACRRDDQRVEPPVDRRAVRARPLPAHEAVMPVYIALLRGVNLAGHKMVAMADLRAMLEGLGFTDERALLQSGNLVFQGRAQASASLERKLEQEAQRRLDLETDVHVRTAAKWQSIIKRNPFPDADRKDPGHLLLMCFKEAPAPKDVKALQAAIKGREVVRAVGRQAYFIYPDGVGTSRLTTGLIDKTLGLRGTARNWNTVLKL